MISRTQNITANYRQAAEFSSDLWSETPHASTLAAQIYPSLRRRFSSWSSPRVWGEALRIGWTLWRAIKAAKANLRITSFYPADQSPACFSSSWDRSGDFLSVDSENCFPVVDLRSGLVAYCPASPRLRQADSLDFADAKNWDRQISERTWPTPRPSAALGGPQTLEAYRSGQTSNWTGD